MEISQRVAEKKSRKRAAHGGKVQRLKFSFRILHNELTVAVYLYCRDLLLFQFLRITENCKMADVSVQRNGTKLCSSNSQYIHRRGELRNLLSEVELRIVEGTTADVEPSRGELGVD